MPRHNASVRNQYTKADAAVRSRYGGMQISKLISIIAIVVLRMAPLVAAVLLGGNVVEGKIVNDQRHGAAARSAKV